MKQNISTVGLLLTCLFHCSAGKVRKEIARKPRERRAEWVCPLFADDFSSATPQPSRFVQCIENTREHTGRSTQLQKRFLGHTGNLNESIANQCPMLKLIRSLTFAFFAMKITCNTILPTSHVVNERCFGGECVCWGKGRGGSICLKVVKITGH